MNRSLYTPSFYLHKDLENATLQGKNLISGFLGVRLAPERKFGGDGSVLYLWG